MLSFQHLSVRARLSIAFGTLLFLLLAIATLAIVQLSLANQRFDGFVHGIQARTLLAATVRTEVLGRGVGVRNMALATAPETITKEKALTEAAHARGTKALGELLQMVQAPEVDAATRQLAEHIGTVEKRYAPVALRIVALAEQGQRDEAIAQINEECSPLLLELVAAANAYVEKSQQNAEVQVRNAQKIYSNQRSILLTISLLSLALALAAGIWIVRSLMTDLGADPYTLRKLVGDVTQGDLTRAIRIRPDDSSSVLAAVAQMQQGLIDMVTSVRQQAEAVSSAAEQISSGNADLSARTEAQASTLEQTAAAMEELNAAVRHNADSATQAQQLAQTSSQAATQGGNVVAEVVRDMQGINHSAQRIADIIGVIDGIAFQTNILALNAAVEAARAGDAGRGFAVVASEVRSLAQRSAGAAKEIKELIGSSVERVEDGSRLVSQAGQTMTEIVGSVRRVSGIIHEITASAAEQSDNIGHISQSVTQLDQKTQQNAALVEQSTAASESLREQALQLTRAVSQFKLHDGAAASAQPGGLPAAAAARGRQPARARQAQVALQIQ